MIDRIRHTDTSGPLHVAVVWAPDGPRLVTVAPTAEALLERVAAYVAEHAPVQLVPDDAARVAAHLERGEHADAVRHYFETAERAWDVERLHLGTADTSDAGIAAAVLDGAARSLRPTRLASGREP